MYAPELAFENEDYPVNDFEYLYKVEDTNFWFKSRNRILIHVFNKYLAHLPVAQILEIGCGTGYVLKGLADFPKFRLSGADIYLEGLKYAKKRVPASQFIQLDATRLPFEAEFDVVGAFDTLEHIEQDLTVMQNIYKALKPAGFFFISVPQHRFMWSEVDVRSFHKRRYSRKELLEKLEQAGFKIVYTTSFVFTLFPAILA